MGPLFAQSWQNGHRFLGGRFVHPLWRGDGAFTAGAVINGMLRNLHELRQGDWFQFTALRSAEVPLPQGRLEVCACWGVRTPDGTAVEPWMLACRDEQGVLHNIVLPPKVNVEVESP